MKKLLFILFLFFACGEDPVSPSNPSLTGGWIGTGSGIVINATLSQSGTNVSGSGTFAASGTSVAVTFAGTSVYPNISLNISATTFQDANYTGKFTNDNTHNGKLNGSGFVDLEIIFVRK